MSKRKRLSYEKNLKHGYVCIEKSNTIFIIDLIISNLSNILTTVLEVTLNKLAVLVKILLGFFRCLRRLI